MVGNAVKFRSERRPKIEITAVRDGDWWRFAVSDNGIGIDAKYSEQAFEVFRRLHARHEYEGTGIGLAICERVVEMHGGQIWIESSPGEGTTVFFQLPRHARGSDPA